MRVSDRDARRQALTGPRKATASGPRLRARRGAIAALAGLLMLSFVSVLALAVDFGRLDNLKADLHTSADAAALAGAIELIPLPPHNGNLAADSAAAYATSNPAMQADITVVSVQCGFWIDAFKLYIPNFVGTPPAYCVAGFTNAIEVTVSRQSSGLFMEVLGVTPPNVRAKARAAVTPDLCFVLPATCVTHLVPY